MEVPIQEIEDTEFQVASTTIWEDIELAESFLVCRMFEEALSKSSSALERLFDAASSGGVGQTELLQIKEAAGMVMLQSLKELGRSQDMLEQLKQHFGQITAIPVGVFMAGACIQMLEAPSVVQSFFEEFLSNWRCVDENHYVLAVELTSPSYAMNPKGTLPLDKYLELVEVYAVVLLGKVLNAMDVAISWVEKAEIPESKREDLLRKLHSLYSRKSANTVQSSLSQRNEQESQISSQYGLQVLDNSSEASEGSDISKQSILKLSSRVEPCFWLFRSVNLKFGKVRLVITTGKVLLTFLICLVVYFIKRKRETLFRTAKKQVMLVRKAMVDLWQLAFSYQVNPLAAVQPLPAATRGTG
uniref:3-phosphoinositide-dependent protein kinase-1 n=1 Tax=Kalanchoe fedtschenkoi TaxID=63787 RepID=A0A7N0TUQ8_KALFE